MSTDEKDLNMRLKQDKEGHRTCWIWIVKELEKRLIIDENYEIKLKILLYQKGSCTEKSAGETIGEASLLSTNNGLPFSAGGEFQISKAWWLLVSSWYLFWSILIRGKCGISTGRVMASVCLTGIYIPISDWRATDTQTILSSTCTSLGSRYLHNTEFLPSHQARPYRHAQQGPEGVTCSGECVGFYSSQLHSVSQLVRVREQNNFHLRSK